MAKDAALLCGILSGTNGGIAGNDTGTSFAIELKSASATSAESPAFLH